MSTSTINPTTSHVITFVKRAESAHQAWAKQTTASNKRIANVSAKRAQGIRKNIIDSNMRYTELVNLASDWAWGRNQAGLSIPTVSSRVSQARQLQALEDIANNDGADWLNKLVLSEDKTVNLRNTGDRYNAEWLLAHDTRWAIAILHSVVDRMTKAGLI